MVTIMSTKKNKLLVRDVMLENDKFPVVDSKELMKETLDSMNYFGIGIACIVNKQMKMLGVLTDGDLRRTLLRSQKPLSSLFVDDVLDHAALEFKSIGDKNTLIEGVKFMEKHKIWDLPVVDKEGTLLGLLHLHPAIVALLEI